MDTLLDESQIAAVIDTLAQSIKAALGDTFTCIALMDGAFVFAADLMRALHKLGASPEFESFGLSSYGDERQSSGHVTITALSRRSLAGKKVLIIDDVLETGRTLETAKEACIARGAQSVKLCVFAQKPKKAHKPNPSKTAKRPQQIKADFVGWEAPDRFLIGYGLDDAGRHRGQPFIGALD